MGDRNGETFGYAEFGSWYDAHRAETLEPALDRAMDALQRELDDALSERDLARIRSISGRVKSKRRTWRKVNQRRYRQQIPTVDEIPTVIDDLVGMRLTCTNLRDIEMVQVALESLPVHADKRHPLGLDPTSERDYVEHPKQSGYRGWHVNLAVHHEGEPVTCELQVRTLLQDSWGELTHEDTYSKAGEIAAARRGPQYEDGRPARHPRRHRRGPPQRTRSHRRGDRRRDRRPDRRTRGDELAAGPAADAADLLLERWRSLDRPLELASLAWALQHEFGAEVSDDWFGFRTFKRFLRAAVPDGEISSGRQAYLLPPGGTSDGPETDPAGAEAVDEPMTETDVNADEVDDDPSSTVPSEARRLRRVDRGFPLVETDQWRRIYEQLAAAWRRVGAGAPSTKMVNQLGRDRTSPGSRHGRSAVAAAPRSRRESGPRGRRLRRTARRGPDRRHVRCVGTATNGRAAHRLGGRQCRPPASVDGYSADGSISSPGSPASTTDASTRVR